jgi:hypothetical protein
MNETFNVVCLRQPDAIDDPLTEILRAGARMEGRRRCRPEQS